MSELKEAAEYRCVEKKIKNWAIDAPSPDTPGNFTYPVHTVTRTTRVPRMENPCNLHLLIGKCFIFAGFPSQIRGGSGSPIRAAAILS